MWTHQPGLVTQEKHQHGDVFCPHLCRKVELPPFLLGRSFFPSALGYDIHTRQLQAACRGTFIPPLCQFLFVCFVAISGTFIHAQGMWARLQEVEANVNAGVAIEDAEMMAARYAAIAADRARGEPQEPSAAASDEDVARIVEASFFFSFCQTHAHGLLCFCGKERCFVFIPPIILWLARKLIFCF